MAHTKAGGSTRLGRDSQSKRLGVKLHAGEQARAGQILVRQRGAAVRAGQNVSQGGDDTLYAAITGTVHFSTRRYRTVTGHVSKRTTVSVVPSAA